VEINRIADKAYRDSFALAVEKARIYFKVLERAEKTKGFVLEQKRWEVERTFTWLNFFRRVVIDYEHTLCSARSFLFLANISMSLWRLKYD
jgi:transposase